MNFYDKNIETLLRVFETDTSKGLSLPQVTKSREKYGENKLNEKKKKTFLMRFGAQFKDVMIIILLFAALISFVLALMEGNKKDFIEPILIVLIVLLNAFMGVFQESKAEKALDALKNLAAPKARVIRDGKEEIIDALDLVPGDQIHIEAGDFVPADARIISSSSLASEESALTGESLASEKDSEYIADEKSALGDRKNMIFSGCSISYGTGTAIVTATGMNTEIGKIAGLLEGEKEETTPLQKKLASLGKYLGIVALIACAIVFVIGIIEGKNPIELFMVAVSLAVSAIPEGLPAIVTIVLSIGVQRMVKKNAIIRKLPAVETLGSASVICSDKTGTLTQNRMTLVEAYLDGEESTHKISADNSESIRKLLLYGSLCSDGSVRIDENGNEEHIGDPTETSIIMAALKNGLKKEDIQAKYPRVQSLPFDSDRKLMSVICQIDGENVVITKGAFDVLSDRCTSGDMSSATKIAENMSSHALRVLGIAYKKLDKIPDNLDSGSLENNLTLLGLVGMIDPPRLEAKESVALCKKAGIKPVMITGDHVVTASAIASELGILGENDRAITGLELDEMSEQELLDNIYHIAVYARVSPENKIRIVKAFQQSGAVVAMTGDGVNDAPALKAADIGCAMGITGTDVAKGAADMILTDDNFSTIVETVKEGRGIYANIKKVINFLLGTNIGEILTVLFAMILFKESPLISIQLLWINLITDSLPAIALGVEPVEDDIMEQEPIHKNESIFAHGVGIRIVCQGAMFALLTLIAFRLGWSITGELSGGRTMAFIVLSLTQIVQAFNMRTSRSLFKSGFFTNKKLNQAAIISIALIAIIIFTPVSIAFGIISLPISLYFVALGLSLLPLVVMETYKLLKNKKI